MRHSRYKTCLLACWYEDTLESLFNFLCKNNLNMTKEAKREEVFEGKSSSAIDRVKKLRSCWTFNYLLEFLFDGSSANDEWPSENMFCQSIIAFQKSNNQQESGIAQMFSCDAFLPHCIFHCFDARIDVIHLKAFCACSFTRWHVSRRHWIVYRIKALTKKHWLRRRPAQMTTEPAWTNELKTCCHLRNEWTWWCVSEWARMCFERALMNIWRFVYNDKTAERMPSHVGLTMLRWTEVRPKEEETFLPSREIRQK